MPLTAIRQRAARELVEMEPLQLVDDRTRESLAAVAARRLEALRGNLAHALRTGFSDKSAAKAIALLLAEDAQRGAARVVNASTQLCGVADQRICVVGRWSLRVGNIGAVNQGALELWKVARDATETLRRMGGNALKLQALGDRLGKLNLPVAAAAFLIGSLACLLCSGQSEKTAG